jgi:tetratricopeptide (TPR) repeat protein
MTRRICALLVLLVLTVPAQAVFGQAASRSADFDRVFSRAMAMQQAGDVIGAVEGYKTALSIDPNRVDALSNLGAAYVHLGQFDDAIAQYTRALGIDPANATVRMNLALAFYKSARPNEAVQPLKMVVATAPETKSAYLILADCYLQTGQAQEAVALLQPRAAMFGDDLAFAYVLGTALLQTGNETDGQRYIDRIFRSGDSAEGHLLLGIAYLNKFDYKPAKAELERALQLNARLPTVNSAYGRALLALGDQAEAQRAFGRELAVNVNDFESNLELGSLRKNAQDFEGAAAYLARAVAIHPQDLTSRKLLASLRLQTGQTEEAARLLEGVVTDAPDAVDAHVQLATAYHRLKRKADADREQAIVDRLNRDIQARQAAANAAGRAASAPAATAPNPAPAPAVVPKEGNPK